MIFVGGGSLLWRAVRATQAAGHRIDLVVVADAEMVPAAVTEVPLLRTADVNAAAPALVAAATDSLVWSINNPTILRPALLDSGLRVLNIHNGPLPAYRGLPEVAIVHALLAGESRYAATLHVVDAGIDTGTVLGVEEFDIAPDATFADVMLAGLRACHRVFERNLDAALDDTLTALPASDVAPGYHGRRDLVGLAAHRDNPRYRRAVALGVFAPQFPDLAAAVAAAEATVVGS